MDAGHGGEDGGAIGLDGTVEKTLNLEISLKLQDFLEASGYKVIMTRENDKAIYDSDAKTLKEIIVQNNVTGCTVMLNRKLVSMCCNIPENVIMHDWWVALIAAAFGVVGFVNEPTILYRQHESNQVGSKNVGSILFMFNKLLHGGEIKKSILATYSQCEAFLGRYSRDLSLDQKSMLESYLMVACGNKLKRIKRLLCGGFLKYGFVRKLGQIIYV